MLKILTLSIIVIMFDFLPKMSFGQIRLEGRVVDASGKGLEFVTVGLFQDSINVKEVITDTMGLFSFENLKPISYELDVTSLENKLNKNIIQLKLDTFVIVKLDSQVHRLTEVEIKATNAILERKGDRFVYIPSKLGIENKTALDLLQHSPLIIFSPATEVFSVINKKNTLITINNKKTILPKELIIQMLKSLPAGDINSIDIITSPGSEYEVGGYQGVININIKKK